MTLELTTMTTTTTMMMPPGMITHTRQKMSSMFLRHRLEQATSPDAQDPENPDVRPMFPPELVRRYEVHFVPPGSSSKLLSGAKSGRTWPILVLEEVRFGRWSIGCQGHLHSCAQVKPIVSIATYTCAWGYEIYQEIKSEDVHAPDGMCK